MIQSALQQAGINCLEFSSDSLEMKEILGASIVRLHSLQDVRQLNSGELELPEKTGQCRGSNPAALCLRPREWLLISNVTEPVELLAYAKSNLGAERTAIYDNSDGLAIFRLSGSGAPWLLSKLSSLDYLAGTAAGEHCTRTRMGKIAVVVHYHQAGDDQFVFDLLFDRSVAKYLWDLLSDIRPACRRPGIGFR